MKIYISGKITGLPIEVAFSNFNDAENDLKTKGHEAVAKSRKTTSNKLLIKYILKLTK